MVGHYPKTLEQALHTLEALEDATVIAGGTDVMVRGAWGENLVFLNQIGELRRIQVRSNEIAIGAGCTFTELIDTPALPVALREVFADIASPAIRNRATIGGNICNASPVGDSLPALYALGARVRLARETGGERELPIRALIHGIGKTALGRGELLVQVLLPRNRALGVPLWVHQKVAARKAEAISKVSFFGLACTDNGRVTRFGVAFGAVGVTMVFDAALEAAVVGLDGAGFRRVRHLLYQRYLEKIHPIDDQRSTADYRKKVAGHLLWDFLDRLEAQLEGT